MVQQSEQRQIGLLGGQAPRQQITLCCAAMCCNVLCCAHRGAQAAVAAAGASRLVVSYREGWNGLSMAGCESLGCLQELHWHEATGMSHAHWPLLTAAVVEGLAQQRAVAHVAVGVAGAAHARGVGDGGEHDDLPAGLSRKPARRGQRARPGSSTLSRCGRGDEIIRMWIRASCG